MIQRRTGWKCCGQTQLAVFGGGGMLPMTPRTPSRLLHFCLHWNNTNKQRRKVKSDTIPHRTPQKALDKMIGTLNLIFGSTPLGKNNWNHRFLEPWMSFLHLSTVILDHSSFANCSRSFRFEGCLLLTGDLSTVFYGIQIWTHCWSF